MSKRGSAIAIADILRSIDHINQYRNGLTFESFSGNFMVVEACLYNIQVIGEAVTHISTDIKEASPVVPWSLIKSMRNRLIHEYFGIDLQLVWNVIQDDLPILKKELEILQGKL
jgi:uncharacterized protein with HEPN domain